MGKIFLSILLSIILQNVFSQNKDAEQLKMLNQEWLSSLQKKDTATLASIFADDFVSISPNGAKMTKRDAVKNILYQDIVTINIDSSEVRLLTNDVGLVTCYLTFVLKIDGKDVTGKNCYQDVYIKRKNRWYAVSAHVTLLNLK